MELVLLALLCSAAGFLGGLVAAMYDRRGRRDTTIHVAPQVHVQRQDARHLEELTHALASGVGVLEAFLNRCPRCGLQTTLPAWMKCSTSTGRASEELHARLCRCNPVKVSR